MPKIRRWFHLSHDLNADHEVWELTTLLGDRALRIWIEILSIADRNAGEIPGWAGERLAAPSPELGRCLANRCRTSGQTVVKACRFFDERLWTVPGNPYRVRNHWKYRMSREGEGNPVGNGKDFPTTPTPTPTPTTIKKETYDVSSARQNGNHSDLSDPTEAWLLKFITETQGIAPPDFLNDSPWWESVALTCGGVDLEFLTVEFARMSAWLNENAQRKPASKTGWKKFIRTWLERSHEKTRRTYNAPKTPYR